MLPLFAYTAEDPISQPISFAQVLLSTLGNDGNTANRRSLADERTLVIFYQTDTVLVVKDHIREASVSCPFLPTFDDCLDFLFYKEVMYVHRDDII